MKFFYVTIYQNFIIFAVCESYYLQGIFKKNHIGFEVLLNAITKEISHKAGVLE